MGRMLAGFVLGAVLGFVGLQLALRVAAYYIDGPEAEAADSRGMPVANYRAWTAGKRDRPFGIVSAFGAIVCGGVGAIGFNRPVVAVGRRSRRRRGGSDQPLSRDELQQVLQACVWMPIDARSPEYVRGLAVGRLAENQPALAKKVDEVSDYFMDMLHRDLCRRRARGM